MKIRRVIEIDMLTISKVKEEISGVDEVESGHIPNGFKIVHGPTRLATIDGVPIRQHHHLIKHPVQPARRLMDRGQHGPTGPGESPENRHDHLSRR